MGGTPKIYITRCAGYREAASGLVHDNLTRQKTTKYQVKIGDSSMSLEERLKAIEEAWIVLVFVCVGYANDNDCMKEINHAVSENKIILPIYLDKGPEANLENCLEKGTDVLTRIWFSQPEMHKDAIKKISESVNDVRRRPNTEIALHFIYSRDCLDGVYRIRNLLKFERYRVPKITESDNTPIKLSDEVCENIRNCNVVVCFLSRTCVSICREELEYAVRNHPSIVFVNIDKDYKPDARLTKVLEIQGTTQQSIVDCIDGNDDSCFENHSFPKICQKIHTRIYKIKIYISYSWHTLKEGVRELARELKKNPHFEVFLDIDGMTGQANVNDSMYKNIDWADVVLCFFSSDYEESINCRKELEYAVNKRKGVFPIGVDEDCKPDGYLLFLFGSLFRLDFNVNNLLKTYKKIKELLAAERPKIHEDVCKLREKKLSISREEQLLNSVEQNGLKLSKRWRQFRAGVIRNISIIILILVLLIYHLLREQ